MDMSRNKFLYMLYETERIKMVNDANINVILILMITSQNDKDKKLRK